MLKSLLNGLSGVRGHQTQLDVIGTNIANVNTVGYKSVQATFQQTLNQMITSVEGPSSSRGGSNAKQIGLGSRVGAIKSTFTQGSLLDTENTTDLAILGNGFFIVKTGDQNYYTRAGGFDFDGNGTLVNGQGLSVQGKLADEKGEIPQNAVVGNIQVPADTSVPPKSTGNVQIAGNLDAEQSLLGTITQTKALLATAAPDEAMSGLYANGAAETFMSLIEGLDTLTFGDDLATQTYIYGTDFTSIQDLSTRVNTDFAGRFQTTIGAEGQLTVTSAAPQVTLVARSNTNSALDAAFSNVNESVLITDPFTGGQTVDSDQFAHTATRTDPVIKLRSAQGDPLGVQVGDDLTLLAASFGGERLPSSSLLADIAADTTFETFRLNLTQSLFGDTPQPEEKVLIQSDGRLRIEGGLGTPRALTDLKIGAGVDPGQDTRLDFSSSLNFFEEQAAADVTHTMTTTVYDRVGEAHTLQIEFGRTREPGKWTWQTSLTGQEIVRSGSTGIIQFNRDGSLNSFQYDAGATSFSFDPGNDSELVSIDVGVGSEGEFDGVTFFASPSTASVADQDGYTLGSMESINIDQSGIIFANFSNGVRKGMAQISLAQFNNPSGLIKAQDSLFLASVNSGTPIVGDPNKTILAKIVSKSLERSTVDIAAEFTRLITAQRGLQANSRVITTSDDVLNELLNLKR